MKTFVKRTIFFEDPYFHATVTEQGDDFDVVYPKVELASLKDALNELTHYSEDLFSKRTPEDVRSVARIVDRAFSDMSEAERNEIVLLLQKTSGFSQHDIEIFGLGVFTSLVSYDEKMIGKYIESSMKTADVVETCFGYLKRFGLPNPFVRWREPKLLSHFPSGNVVGYTSILTRMGFPIKKHGAAQVFKIPSASALFPMLYLNKLKDTDPELRSTVAAGFWKGGDNDIERSIIENSDAINLLGSDYSVKDLGNRIKRYNRKAVYLPHGHKIGVSYVSSAFVNDSDLLDRTLDGLVRDISAFDGGACYNVKNIYVQGEVERFSELLFDKLDLFERNISPVSQRAKAVADEMYNIYLGSPHVLSSDRKNAFVRFSERAVFWKPDELFRYVHVMPVSGSREVYELLNKNSRYLQTAVVAVPDKDILRTLVLFGKAGISNVHYPGSAPLFNVYEEPHDGIFDFLKIRYPSEVRFAATNFKKNRDWLI